MSILDRLTPDEHVRRWLLKRATAKGRRIDRAFERACAKHGIDPVAARLASPLLALAIAELEQQNLTNAEICGTSPPVAHSRLDLVVTEKRPCHGLWQ